MTIPTSVSTDLEVVSYNSPAGSIQLGQHRQVISEGVATRQLTAAESGSMCCFDRAAGVVYTLPTPVKGMYFDFIVTTAVTSNAHKTITKTIASEFMVGGIIMGDVTVAQSGDFFEADGTTIAALSADGATKGGLLGEHYRLTAISTTQWAIHGVCHGAGTLATPFATS